MQEIHILQGLFVIIFLGIISFKLFEKLKLPGIIGLILLGVLTGPYLLNIIDSKTLEISSIIRKIALVVILIRAGLGIKKSALKEIGVNAILLSFIPLLLETFIITLISMWLFSFDFLTALLLGCIVSAVSPAVIVPSMLELIDKKVGETKKIPTMILASASLDDIVAITLFTITLSFFANNNTSQTLISIPSGIILAVLIGVAIGFLLVFVFKLFKPAPIFKALIIFATGIFLLLFEQIIDNFAYISFISLLSIIIFSFILLENDKNTAKEVSPIFKSMWIFLSLFLFVLVGAEVSPNVALNAGLKGIFIITIGLLFRSIGVFISLIKSKFTFKEKLFCVYSFWPKATVQAAIGGIPLALGIPGGEIILAISVLAILTTAPLGAFLIKRYSYLIESE